MTYELKFLPSALKEWHGLDATIKNQLKKKLAERLEQPHFPSARLNGFDNHYKIKLRALGFRLAYEILSPKKTLLVIAVGKRENNKSYGSVKERCKK